MVRKGKKVKRARVKWVLLVRRGSEEYGVHWVCLAGLERWGLKEIVERQESWGSLDYLGYLAIVVNRVPREQKVPLELVALLGQGSEIQREKRESLEGEAKLAKIS